MKLQTFDKIKKYIKLLIAYPQYYGLFSEINKHEENRAILIGTPIHGNLGDSLIAQQCVVLLRNRYQKVLEIPEFFYEIFSERLDFNESDSIFICGGGWMGDLYEDELVVEDVLLRWPNHKKVILPQTISFTKSGKYSSTEKLRKILREVKNTIVCVRDEKSYKVCINELGLSDNTCIYLPDMALLRLQETNCKLKDPKKVIFSIRNDVEKCSDDTDIMRIKEYLNEKGFQCIDSSTVISKKIVAVSKRDEYVQHKIDEYSRASLVITDRLHSMVFALVAGCKCIAIDNSTKKVSGVSKGWLENMSGLWLAENTTLLTEKLVEACLASNEYPSNMRFLNYYDKLFERMKLL